MSAGTDSLEEHEQPAPTATKSEGNAWAQIPLDDSGFWQLRWERNTDRISLLFGGNTYATRTFHDFMKGVEWLVSERAKYTP